MCDILVLVSGRGQFESEKAQVPSQDDTFHDKTNLSREL